MQRTAINPWPWSVPMGFNQAELLDGATRRLVCSGQTAVDADGAPQHAGDMEAQLRLTLDNLEAVLAEAGMSLGDVTRLGVFATDVDALMPHFGVLAERLGAAQAAPPMTLLGVTRLALPGLMVEIEAEACA